MTQQARTTAAVQLAGVTKRFGSVTAVDDVSLSIQPGEVVALLGPNGAGKTSTIDMILGLQQPTAGAVSVHDMAPRTAVALGAVSAVMQTGGLLKEYTVGETVELTASLFTPVRPVGEVLERAGIADIRDRRVGKCSGGQQQRLRFALALLPDPDVALLDVEMPGLDGVAAARQLLADVPGCRVLMVTTFGRPGYLQAAMAAGASGFVVKDTPARQLADAVHRVHAGLRVVDPQFAADSLAEGTSALTDRETDVLRAAREGGTVSDIARSLHLSEGTVRNHLSSAIGKTGARTRAEAVRVADENGWLLR